jgi:hypothetical protein
LLTPVVYSSSKSDLLRSSQTEFNYDDQPSSSNSAGPPAGEGSSGKGYLNTIGEAVSGFIGGLKRVGDSHGSDRNDSERRNDNWDTRTHSKDNTRDNLRDIANITLRILDEGEYFPPGRDGPYDLTAKILWTDENTRYYGPDAGEGGEILESEFIRIIKEGGVKGEEEKEEERNKDGDTGPGEEANDVLHYPKETKQGENESEKAIPVAASKPNDDENVNPKDQTRVQATVPPVPQKRVSDDTPIFIGEYSTLIGARKVYLALASNPSANNKKIGVLNFASAKKPGGGFVNGSQAQVRFLFKFFYMILT